MQDHELRLIQLKLVKKEIVKKQKCKPITLVVKLMFNLQVTSVYIKN